MTIEEEERERHVLAEAALALGQRVEVLAARLSVSQREVRRIRLLTALAAVLAAMSVVGALVSIRLWQHVDQATSDNRAVAVQGCRNANDARAANAVLWGFVIDLSQTSGRSNQTPEGRAQLERVRTWVNQLYAPHDCSDLGRRYPIPAPPTVVHPGS